MTYDIIIGNTIKFDDVIGHHIYYSYGRSINNFPSECKENEGLRNGIYQTKIFNEVPYGFNLSLEKFKEYKFIQIY